MKWIMRLISKAWWQIMSLIWIWITLNQTLSILFCLYKKNEVIRKGTCIHLAVWLLIWVVTRLKLLVAVVVAVDDENLTRFFKILDAILQTLNSLRNHQTILIKIDKWIKRELGWNSPLGYKTTIDWEVSVLLPLFQ